MLFWTSISIAHLAAFCGFVFSCIPQKYTQLCATKSRVVIPLPAFVAVWSVATAPANIQKALDGPFPLGTNISAPLFSLTEGTVVRVQSVTAMVSVSRIGYQGSIPTDSVFEILFHRPMLRYAAFPRLDWLDNNK